ASMPPGDQPPKPRERSQQLLREMKAHDAALEEALTPEQLRRLGQIILQRRGLRTFHDPDVANALGLTQDQRDQLREICGPGFGPVELFMRGPGKMPPPRPEHAKPPRREPPADHQVRWRQALAVLPPEQRERWKALVGPPS